MGPRVFAGACRRGAVVLALVASACATSSVAAQDIYFGTLELEEGALSLRRCSLGGDRYLLRDAAEAGATPVADYVAGAATRTGTWQVAVVGTYVEHDDGHALDVIAFDDLRPGSCHLMDALEGAAPAPSP